jgi:glycosyltransferase involved in cell wall biosynthesis
MAVLTLDIVLPTFNRADLLPRTLDSLISAKRPEHLEISIYVVDNNSKDNTADLVRDYQCRFDMPLHYVLEHQQGSAAALNAGIRAGTGELVGMINDDEEVDAHWFWAIYSFFSTTDFDFAGGPYEPSWAAEKPDWMSKAIGGVVGWVDGGDYRQEYGKEFSGILMGGNAVIRRRALQVVGLYDVRLGRTDKGLGCLEDENMYFRLLAAGFRGMYLPELIIHHYVPAERMTKTYHREWCWGQGNSMAVASKEENNEVAKLFGIPRWRLRHAAIGLFRAIRGYVGLEKPWVAFEGELRVWTLLGLIHGKVFPNPRQIGTSSQAGMQYALKSTRVRRP